MNRAQEKALEAWGKAWDLIGKHVREDISPEEAGMLHNTLTKAIRKMKSAGLLTTEMAEKCRWQLAIFKRVSKRNDKK